MVGVLVLASVGFDERFIVRHVVSTGLGVGGRDKIYAFLPAEDKDDRGLKVVDSVRELADRYGLGLEFEVVRVDVGDFWGSAGAVRRVVEKSSKDPLLRELHLLLGGGMRVLGFIVFTGALAARYRPARSNVYIYREDLRGWVVFPLDVYSIERPPQQVIDTLAKLSSANNRVSISRLASDMGVAKSTLHRRIIYMEKSGLVKLEKKGRFSRIRLLDPAKLWL